MSTSLPDIESSRDQTPYDQLRFLIKQSVVFQTTKTAISPIRSLFAYVQGLHGNGDLTQWLHQKPIEAFEFGDVLEVQLGEFVSHLKDIVEQQDYILGEKHSQLWQQIKQGIPNRLFPEDHQSHNYEVLDQLALRNGVLFFVINIGNNIGNNDSLKTSYKLIAYRDNHIQLYDETFESDYKLSDIETELLLLENTKHVDVENSKVSILSLGSTANAIPVIHHEDFEREGNLIRRIMFRGGDSYDEIESVVQILLQRGLKLSDDGISIEVPNQNLKNLLYELVALSNRQEKNFDSNTLRTIPDQVDEVLRTYLYFRYTYEWLLHNPLIVAQFMERPSFAVAEMKLLDQSMVSTGQSHYQNAVNILANTMLWRFEGWENMEQSATQKQYASAQSAFTETAQYLYRQGAPILNIVRDSADNIIQIQYEALRNLRSILVLRNALPADLFHESSSRWFKAFKDNYSLALGSKLNVLRAEIQRREGSHPIYLDALEKLGFTVDPKRRHSVLTTLIGNFLVAKVLSGSSGDQRLNYAMQAVIPDTLGFITDVEDKALTQRLLGMDHEGEALSEVSSGSVIDALQYIFSGNEYTKEGHFVGQALRIVKVFPTILNYLMYDDQVPENVKEVTKLIADPKRLMNEALKLIDPAWADNMYYVNIFAHNGSTAWHKERVLTWVRDFVTATESEIKFKEGIGDNLERRFVGWKPLKQIPSNDDIVKIVSHVLTECSNRIRFVGHEPKDEVYQGNSIQNAIAYMLQWPGRQPVSMRDFMDVLETVFASMLPSAEYVRKRLWWSLTQHIVAESWRCACMLRDQHSFFNVKTAVAY